VAKGLRVGAGAGEAAGGEDDGGGGEGITTRLLSSSDFFNLLIVVFQNYIYEVCDQGHYSELQEKQLVFEG
jgi:hypothetical protein